MKLIVIDTVSDPTLVQEILDNNFVEETTIVMSDNVHSLNTDKKTRFYGWGEEKANILITINHGLSDVMLNTLKTFVLEVAIKCSLHTTFIVNGNNEEMVKTATRFNLNFSPLTFQFFTTNEFRKCAAKIMCEQIK